MSPAMAMANSATKRDAAGTPRRLAGAPQNSTPVDNATRTPPSAPPNRDGSSRTTTAHAAMTTPPPIIVFPAAAAVSSGSPGSRK
jgi:hypothetical protein